MYYCYHNGQFTPSAETQLNVMDLGVLRGYSLFDYFRTYNKIPFQWDAYWQRFENSAKWLQIPIPLTKEEVYNIVLQLVEKSNQPDIAIRLVLTGGNTLDGISSSEPNFFVIAEKITAITEDEVQKGIKVLTHEYVRDIPEIKTTDYKHLLYLQSELKKQNAKDVLFVKDGIISELSRSNVFVFKGNMLITPKENILKGITRKTILEIAQKQYEIVERNITLEELLTADEVFTTSTTKKVLTISQIDNHILSEGIGENTKQLLSAFEKITQTDC